MPTYPPPLANFSSSYWLLNTKIMTPTGTMEGAFMLQNQPDGSATLLCVVNGDSNGLLRANADWTQMGLDGSPTGTGLPKFGFGSPYQPAFLPNSSQTGNTYPVLVRAPCHLIGINLGIRKGGYLGCNVSIGYFPENAKPMAGFWQQDISYYRQWDYIGTPPPPYFWTTSLPNPLPSAPDGWTYAVGPPFVFSGDGKFYNAAVPLPTGYRPVTPIRYGGGSPVFASQDSVGYGQLFQQDMPTSADATPDPRSGTSHYQQILAGLDTNIQTLINNYSNEWAFIGDIFPLPPYNFLTDAFGEIFWLSTPPHSAWGAATIPADVGIPGQQGASVFGNNVGSLTHISTPFVPIPLIGPDFGYFGVDGNGSGNGFVMDAYGRVTPPVPFLTTSGIPLGLGCTIYYLSALKISPSSPPPPPPPPPPPCNIKIVQTQYVVSPVNVTSLELTLNNPVAAGNTLLVVVRGENNQPITVTDSQGNVYAADVQQDSQSEYILGIWRTSIVTNGQLTVTVTTPPKPPAGGPIAITFDLIEVAGLAASPLVMTDYRTGEQGNVHVGGNGMVGDNCDLLIASCISAATQLQSYPDAPWTTLEAGHADDNTGDTVWQETHGVVVGPAAYWTLQSAVPWTAIMVAYKTS